MSRRNKTKGKTTESPKPPSQIPPVETTTTEKPAKPETQSPSSWITVFLPIAAVIIACASFANSCYQTVQARKIFRSYVRPDVQCVVRHSSRPEDRDNPLAAELVIWNNGPIKATSVSMAYRVYVVIPDTLRVPASEGISEDLLDAAILQPELSVGGKIIKPVFGSGPMAIFVVSINYYRDSDMEKFSRQDFFLYESGAYADQQS